MARSQTVRVCIRVHLGGRQAAMGLTKPLTSTTHLGCQRAAARDLLLQELHSRLQLQLCLAVWHGAAQGQLLQLEGVQQGAGHAAAANSMAAGPCRGVCASTHTHT